MSPPPNRPPIPGARPGVDPVERGTCYRKELVATSTFLNENLLMRKIPSEDDFGAALDYAAISAVNMQNSTDRWCPPVVDPKADFAVVPPEMFILSITPPQCTGGVEVRSTRTCGREMWCSL